MYSKLFTLIFALGLYITTVQAEGYQFRLSINGWIKPHKVAATWEEAYSKCQNEGAELASPVTYEMLSEMKNLIGINDHSAAYFIDAVARYVPGIFVSIKGVPLNETVVTDMIDHLDRKNGDCLSMDRQQIRVVSCEAELLYICYREKMENETMTECGTYDPGYQFESETGSCYKHHEQIKSWQQSYATCVAEGAYLAVINNKREASILSAMFSFVDPFIGLQALKGDTVWTSIHGDPVEKLYNVWYENCNLRQGRRCGALYFDLDLFSHDCDAPKEFICEKDPQVIQFYY